MKTMTEKFKILSRYIKDMSSETRNIETYLFVKDHISKYQLVIDINSTAIKNHHIEVDTTLKFEDKSQNKLKSFFEIIYSAVVKVDESIKEKKEMEKILLCDVPNKIYPDLEKSFLNLLHNSGYTDIKFEKKIDFENLYNKKFS